MIHMCESFPECAPSVKEKNIEYGRLRSEVKFGVRSPKFVWAPCAQLHSLAKNPQPPILPRIWAHI
jgi:hypothetical protein